MRVNIVIDDDPLERARRTTGAKSKRESVELELGLAALVRLKEQEEIRGLRGNLRWTGDLEEARRNG